MWRERERERERERKREKSREISSSYKITRPIKLGSSPYDLI
jgi:hypothetical protein